MLYRKDVPVTIDNINITRIARVILLYIFMINQLKCNNSHLPISLIYLIYFSITKLFDADDDDDDR